MTTQVRNMNTSFVTRLGLLFLLSLQHVSANTSQLYHVSIIDVENKELAQTLTDASTLIKLQQVAPVEDIALLGRAQKDIAIFTTVLHSFGYYKGQVTLKIADIPIDDPQLHARLEQTPDNQSVEVSISVQPGPLFHVGKLQFQGTVPQTALKQLTLSTGAPARAKDILAAREKLLQALWDLGYALAQVEEPIATLQPDADLLNIEYQVIIGPISNIGTIKLTGLKQVNEAFIRQRLLIKSGTRFNPTNIEKARQDLVGLGVFTSVRVNTAKQLNAQQQLDLDYSVIERLPRAFNFGASYYTDLGGSLSMSWLHRNLLGNAEQLTLNSAVTQIAGNSTIGIGYNISAAFLKPDFLQRDQTLQLNLRAVQQHLLAYDQTAVLGEGIINRKLSEHWSVGIGLAGEQSHIIQQGVSYDYTLLSLPMQIKFDNSNNLLDPTHGLRANMTITPTQPLAGALGAIFVQMQLAASSYYDLLGNGRSVLALRGMISDTQGVGPFGLPPDKRAYAGGSASVRGYAYQSIGPRFADNNPQGGIAMSAATIELRQRFLENWGIVMFVDTGQVSSNSAPFTSDWHWGAGVGVRYYTSFGPIRVDVGLPLNPQPDSGSFQLYVSLGQAF